MVVKSTGIKIIGNMVHIGDHAYYKENLEKGSHGNVCGRMRYNKRTEKHEFYDPRKEPFGR